MAGLDGILAGISGFLYAYSFIILPRSNPTMAAFFSGLFLLTSGLFAIKVIIAVYLRVREFNSGYAIFALNMSLFGAFGMIIHGGYDLANTINPPNLNLPNLASLPSQIDPRGLLSFGVMSMGLFINSWLLKMDKRFPKTLALVGTVSAAFLLILYLGRLILLAPTHPVILYSAIINGFIVSPLWYIWLGYVLWTEKRV